MPSFVFKVLDRLFQYRWRSIASVDDCDGLSCIEERARGVHPCRPTADDDRISAHDGE
jgi:hypothetical protein